MNHRMIALSIALALASGAGQAVADDAGHPPKKLDRQNVNAEADADPLFPQIAKEIEDGKVLTGKKSTVVVLDDQPEVVNNELRQTFARLPGLLLSEQQIPGHFNINYRGLGDPHESEFVSFFENGLPLASDWFGYPTMYYLPPIDRVDRIAFVRGGSSLLYGPQPGPSINFITKVPGTSGEIGLRSRHTGGEDGMYATYNELSGGTENFGWLLSYDHRTFDGTRDNADSDVDGANVSLFWRQNDAASWRFDFYSYDSESGEAGRLSGDVYDTQPDFSSTPNNRLWIERDMAVLSHALAINDSTQLDAKLWHASQDRYSERQPRIFPNSLPINVFTAFDRQEFSNTGLDARVTHDWGSNHTLTFGMTHYVDDSPRSQLNVPEVDILATTSFLQERDTDYTAVFAETVFRFDRWSLIPAARFEWLEYDIFEPEVLSTLTRAPIDRSFDQSVPLLGLGATYDWAEQQLQAYGNVSQGYRPMRFDDVANPSSNLSLNNDPDVAESLNVEFGLRGSPVAGLFFDISLFRIDFDDKIETQQISTTEVLRVNSGDARHQGVELAADYDFFAGAGGDSHLSVFGSASFLDAEITASRNASLVGNTPAFAPDHVFKAGLIYRNSDWLKLALTGTLVDEHYWQDSNLDGGTVTRPIDATVPSYEVFDLSAEWSLNRHFKVLGGVNNLFDETYYSRVRADGIEPAAERTPYLGVEVGF
jgi:Fe(3+) dicitrate transport protein